MFIKLFGFKLKLEIDHILIFLITFTLPMFTRLNNIILGVLIALTFFQALKLKKKPNVKLLKSCLPIFLFFGLALVASLNDTEALFFNHLEKYMSFLLIPLAFTYKSDKIEELIKYAFYGLLFGCIATLLICYINAFFEIIVYKEPLSYFLRWRHLSHRFTEIAGTHPAYLGLFIAVSAYYLLFHLKDLSNKIKTPILLLFFFGIIQLASRVALFIFLITILAYILISIRKKIQLVVFGVLLVSFVSILFVSQGSNYFKERLFSIESMIQDSRFDRLKISFDIFKEHPIIGVGFQSIDDERINKYKESGFDIAAEKGYNSHNQFFEYLSINGLVGVIIYLSVFVYLIVKSCRDRNYLFLFLILTFFIANLTESMMVRIKGIEYFSIFISLFLINNLKSQKNI
jgi:hypothetical protein